MYSRAPNPSHFLVWKIRPKITNWVFQTDKFSLICLNGHVALSLGADILFVFPFRRHSWISNHRFSTVLCVVQFIVRRVKQWISYSRHSGLVKLGHSLCLYAVSQRTYRFNERPGCFQESWVEEIMRSFWGNKKWGWGPTGVEHSQAKICNVCNLTINIFSCRFDA